MASALHEQISLQSIAANREELRHFIADNWPLALLIYVLVYACAIALSIPGADASHHCGRAFVRLARGRHCRYHGGNSGSHTYLSGSQNIT